MLADHDKLREAIKAWRNERFSDRFSILKAGLDIILDAAESTLPRTKMVEVWRVEYARKYAGRWHAEMAQRLNEADAAEVVLELGRRQDIYDSFRVTGPHQQCVPDDGAPANTATDRHSK